MRSRAILRFSAFIAAALLAIGLSACGGSSDSQTGQPGASRGSSQDLNVMVQVTGKLEIKRAGWKDYAPALFGATVQLGDLLRLDPSSQARIACADLSVVDVPQSGGSLPCRSARAVLTENGAEIVAPRGGNSGNFPVVVSPRKTNLLSAHPTIRWTAVDGVDGYIVSVKGAGVDWSAPKAVQGTQMLYPPDAPPLAPGQTYKVTVQAGSASSESEGLPGLGFTLLSQDEAKVVQDGETQVSSLALDPAPQSLLIAHLYASHSLYDEAIERLQGVNSAGREPAIQRLLGDYYLATALTPMAEEHYSQALQLSQAAGDTEGQALAERALGGVYESLGDKGGAKQALQNALALYQQLGDTATTGSIQAQLDQLK